MKRRDFHKLLLGSGAALPFLDGLLNGAATAATPDGGLVTLIQPEPPILVLPLNQQTPTGTVAGKIYESLLTFDFDLTPQPQLAKSWEVSEDGLTYTFHLVETAKWHDGTAFTAADVVFSCDVMLKEVHPRARANFDRCDSITAPDDYTVVFTLKEPFAPFLLAFEASSAPIAPKHIYDGTDYRNNPANDTPIGTGPFKLTEWARGAYIHLTAFDDYYIEGQPGLTEIYYKVVPDAASRSVALETGEANLSQWNDIEPFDVQRLAATPGMEMTTKGYEFFSPLMWYELNLRREPLNDKRFRKAMMYLLDRQFIVDRILFGLGKVATGPVASTTRFYEPDVILYEKNVDKAKALLDEMGLKPDANGIRVSLSFTIPPYGEMMTRTSEYFRQAMAAAGIEIKLIATDMAGWAQAVSGWDYDITSNLLYQYGDPAMGVARTYVSSNIRKGVLFSNTEGYANPKVDELFAKAAIATSDADRQAYYSEAQKIIVDELPVLWISESQYPTIYDARLQDLIVGATGVNGTFGKAHWG